MKKILATIILSIAFTTAFEQTGKGFSIYVFGQYNKTLYDETKSNNPWGMGLGLQGFWHNSSRFSPTLEITADTYLEDDKVMRLTPDDKPINDDLGSMINLFAGAAFRLSNVFYFSFSAGPSFSNGRTMLGIKSAFGFYFSPKQRWTGKISIFNIFKREEITQKSFGALSVALGVRLF